MNPLVQIGEVSVKVCFVGRPRQSIHPRGAIAFEPNERPPPAVGQWLAYAPPLSTLPRNPRGQLRMTRGRCGSLPLHRERLALSTPCRSPGASQIESVIPHYPDIDGANGYFAEGPRAAILAVSKSRRLCLRKETSARPARLVAPGLGRTGL